MEEYRIDIKVKNNIILRKIEENGYKTLGEFCRLNNIAKYASQICSIVNMKESPLQVDGKFRKCIICIADLLGCDPLDFFTDTQLHTLLKTNKRSIQVNEAEMKFMLEQGQTKLLEEIVLDDQRYSAIDKALNELTPRERKVIDMRMGLGEYGRVHTLEEMGNHFNVGRERIRQIEARALRKLRHFSIAEPLRDFLDD
jgi:RNA polymerase sigma factor (sigma-70 family)